MEEQLPNIDFIKCKKCKKPISTAKIDFSIYPISRFVETCKDCEYVDRHLDKSSKEDLINSIKIAETFYNFCKNTIDALQKKIDYLERMVEKHIENKNNQFDVLTSDLQKKHSVKFLQFEDRINVIEKEFSKKEEVGHLRNKFYDFTQEIYDSFAELTLAMEKFQRSTDKKMIDFSRFPSNIVTALKKKFIYLESDLTEIINSRKHISGLGLRGIEKIKEYLNSLNTQEPEPQKQSPEL